MEKQADTEDEKVASSSRRGFIKKAAYVTPSLMTLGALSKSNEAQAQFNLPPSLTPGPTPAPPAPNTAPRPSKG